MTNPSGLATCDAIFARCLVRATPIDIGKPSSARTRARTVLAICCRRTEEMRAPGNVGEGLVDGDALDGRREIAQHSDGGIAEPLVLVEMPADKNEVGTRVAARAVPACRSYAEGPRFVRSCENNAAADRNRLAAQARVKQLFDRGIKGVEGSRVENGGCGTHLVDSSSIGQSSASHASHPPQRRRESRLVECRPDSQAQRHWSATCRNSSA